MHKRFVGPAVFAGLAFVLSSCVTPASRVPDRPAAAAPVAAIAEPSNLYLLKQEIKTYVDDGRYETGLARVAGEARTWVEERSARGGKLAVVFDIDETALSNLRHMREMDFGYVPALWDQWVAEADAPALNPLLDLYRATRARGVAVFFLTGRKNSDAPGTLKNLRDIGFVDYTQIYFKPPGYPSTQAFKTEMRRKITEDGYVIIANIGDQQSDLDGGYSERTFKLPNPFYIIK